MNRLDSALGAILAVRSGLDSLATGRACAALETVLCGFQRRSHARALAAAVGEPNESLWSLAQRMAEMLRHFETTGYPRIAAGYRRPANEVEELMVKILADTPAPCSRSLWEILRNF